MGKKNLFIYLSRGLVSYLCPPNPTSHVVLVQVGDAMEMMILSILGPQLHCEWRLPGYQVALITSVKTIWLIFI